MTRTQISRPDETEYLAYYGRYVALVPEGDVVATLATQNQTTMTLLKSIPEERGGFRYAPGKWSIKELVGHLSDAERIFADRALRFARNDSTLLPGFEEDDYVRNASFDRFPLAELAQGFDSVRRSTIFLFKHLNDVASTRRGKANGAEISVRALAYVIAGHELHHMNVLRTRYLEAATTA